MRALLHIIPLALLACCPSASESLADFPPPAGAQAGSTDQAAWLKQCAAENAIKGSASELTLVSGEASGVTFDAPQFCPGNNGELGAYIRVTHQGKRRLNYHPNGETPCDRVDADLAACPTVSVHVVGMAIMRSLQQKLGDHNADSYGLGLCAKSSEPLEHWNLSCRIHDWRFANEALRIVDAELDRWDIDGEFGLSISGIACGVAL